MTASANAGWAAGIGQTSRAKKIAWALKGAPLRKKDLRLSPLAGISEGRKLRDKVSRMMEEAGANPEDAMVLCVFAERDLSALVPALAYLPVTESASAPDVALVTRHSNMLPIGFLVFVLDHSDPQEPIFGHARPLIVEDPRAIEMNAQALHAYERKIKHKLMASGRIPDERN